MSGRTWELICADVAASMSHGMPRSGWRRAAAVARSLPHVRGLATIGFRLSHAAGRRSPAAGALLKTLTHIVTGADIHYLARIGPGLRLPHPTGVVIGKRAVIGSNCTIGPNVTLASTSGGHPSLGDGVEIAPGACLIGAVRVADGIQVGANAVVTHSFGEPQMVIAGVPARVLRER